MPSVVGAAAAASDSDFSDSDDAIASDDGRDERDRGHQPIGAAPVVPEPEREQPATPVASAAVTAEAQLRQKERQLALLQREVAQLKQRLPQLLAEERTQSVDASSAPGPSPAVASALAASLQAGDLRCVLCQKALASKPQPVNILRVPSPAPTGPTQCQKCSAVCCAVYCSIAHQRMDDQRHATECQAVMGDSETRACVERAARVRPPPRVSRYHCGLSVDHPFEVRRTVASAGTATAATAKEGSPEDPLAKYISRIERSAVLGPGPDKAWTVVRGHTELPSDPTALAAAASKAPPPAVAMPWVSFGSSTSVVLNWLPPGRRFDPRVAPQSYVVEHREVCLGGQRDGGVGTWEPLKEPHEGSVPAHTVRHLSCGTWYQFRILPTGFALEEECVWSEPSHPFRVGFADFSDVEPGGQVDGAGSDCFTASEIAFYLRLNTPALVQDYLDTLPMNHETEDDTCLSALEATRQNCGHCIEGAMIGAFILSLHGHPPYLCDMRGCSRDDDHNVAVFQQDGRWGCLSVSNHASLRWRNPIYKTLRELMMSFFDDYMNNDGERTLRSYSRPVNLAAVFGPKWATVRGDTFHVAEFMVRNAVSHYAQCILSVVQKHLTFLCAWQEPDVVDRCILCRRWQDCVPHYKLCERANLANLRPADPFMMQTTVFAREWPPPENFDEEQWERNVNK